MTRLLRMETEGAVVPIPLAGDESKAIHTAPGNHKKREDL